MTTTTETLAIRALREIEYAMTQPRSELYDRVGTILVNFNVVSSPTTAEHVRARIIGQDSW